MQNDKFEVGDRVRVKLSNIRSLDATVVGYSTELSDRILAHSFNTSAILLMPDNLSDADHMRINQAVSGPKGTITRFSSACTLLAT